VRALRFERYGPPDVLVVEDVPQPVPGKGEAAVRVHFAALNPLDAKLRAGALRYLPLFQGPPRGLGSDFAGEIVAVGGGPTARHVGERVLGWALPFARNGALAEVIVVPYARLLPVPPGVDMSVAATLPVAGGTALQALEDDVHVAAGQRVLLTGAAGGVGHCALQIAKRHGAHVVAVCSASNVEFVRSLGADEVVDYTAADVTQRDDRFDIVFDAACAASFTRARRLLTDDGVYLNTGGTARALAGTIGAAVLARATSRQRAIPVALRSRPELWARLVALVQDGALRVHIERVIGLDEVADAQRAMETGHGRGKIVVRIRPQSA
jgi:NADPH:quinone reductase-like Zn-dependent oxidoreductase